MSRPTSRHVQHLMDKWIQQPEYEVFKTAVLQQTAMSSNHIAGIAATCLAMVQSTSTLPRKSAINRAIIEEAKSLLPSNTPSYLQYWFRIGHFAAIANNHGLLHELKSLTTMDRLRYAANRLPFEATKSSTALKAYLTDAATLDLKAFDTKYPPKTRRQSRSAASTNGVTPVRKCPVTFSGPSSSTKNALAQVILAIEHLYTDVPVPIESDIDMIRRHLGYRFPVPGTLTTGETNAPESPNP